MVNNTMLVKSGAIVYNNRANKTTPDYNIVSGFRVSIDTPDVAWGDTTLSTQIPISGTESVDDCSATTGWTASASDSVTVNSTTYKPDSGTDGALNLIKAATGASTVSAYKTTTSVDGTDKDLLIWFYVANATAYGKLATTGTALTIRFGSDSSNYYYKNYTYDELTTGWNFLKIAITSGFTGTTGSPVIGSLDYTYIAVTTNNNSDTFSEGDIIFDSIRVASADDYLKDVDSVSIDETEISTSTVTKLTVSEANGFLIDGFANVNDDASELLMVKSKFPNNSKDTSDLIKFTTKLKVRNINQ